MLAMTVIDKIEFDVLIYLHFYISKLISIEIGQWSLPRTLG